MIVKISIFYEARWTASAAWDLIAIITSFIDYGSIPTVYRAYIETWIEKITNFALAVISNQNQSFLNVTACANNRSGDLVDFGRFAMRRKVSAKFIEDWERTCAGKFIWRKYETRSAFKTVKSWPNMASLAVLRTWLAAHRKICGTCLRVTVKSKSKYVECVSNNSGCSIEFLTFTRCGINVETVLESFVA